MLGKRSLYQCLNAKVKGDEIYCAKGRRLSNSSVSGNIKLARLAQGDPLEVSVCQSCLLYMEVGPKIKPAERGWY
jgi:hypothetical protein